MKLLVCITTTPDTTAKIAFSADATAFEQTGVTYIMNPYDEWYALVRALMLKEQLGGTVTLLNIGEAANDVIIRKGLAIGADDAIRVNAHPENAYFVAHQIAEQAKLGGYDFIFLGKESIDYNGSEVGAMVAELLKMPFISLVTQMEYDGTNATVTREIEGGSETLSVETPFVLSAAKGLAEQRLASMQGIMLSKRKPLNVVSPVPVDAQLHLSSYSLPPAKTGVKLFAADQMDELVRLLNEVEKVI